MYISDLTISITSALLPGTRTLKLAFWFIASLLITRCTEPQVNNNERADVIDSTDGIRVRKTANFAITGSGEGKHWEQTSWIMIPQRTNDLVNYDTRAKVLYSDKGLYFLFECSDRSLTCTIQQDRAPLYNEDVLEVFLQPDSAKSAYFEYEISPLNFETPILIFNNNGDLNSWHPFEIRDERKIIHATSILNGEKKPTANITGWKAEFFIPFSLIQPLFTQRPVAGTVWKANLYRIDYDKGEALWSWKMNSGDFHEYKTFGQLLFE